MRNRGFIRRLAWAGIVALSMMAARRLAVEAEQCLVVEDSRNGVLAGKAAGMRVAAVPCPATSHEDFGPADLVLPDLEALRKALGLDERLPQVAPA